MLPYLVITVFTVGLVVAWLGWGCLVNWLLGYSQRPHGWLIGLGLAAQVGLGGYLNLLGIISRPLLIGLYLCGLILGLSAIWRRRQKRSPMPNPLLKVPRRWLVVPLALFLLFIVTVRFVSGINPGQYNVYDDLQGYFVFPEKMLQTGRMGADPFSERRHVSSLGGQAFLQTFMLSVGDERYLNGLDAGAAYLTFIIALLSLLARITNPIAALLLTIIGAATPPPTLNTTAVYTGSALCVLLAWLITRIDAADRRDWITLGLVSGASIALKNSFAPPVGFLVVIFLMTKKQKALPDRRFLLTLAAAIAILLPWMAALFQSAHTWFYPLLGAGWHASQYAHPLSAGPTGLDLQDWLSVFGGLLTMMIYGPLLLVGGAGVACLLHSTTRRKFVAVALALAATPVLTIAAMSIATGGYDPARYAFPFALPLLLIAWARLDSALPPPKLVAYVTGAALTLILLQLSSRGGPATNYWPALLLVPPVAYLTANRIGKPGGKPSKWLSVANRHLEDVIARPIQCLCAMTLAAALVWQLALVQSELAKRPANARAVISTVLANPPVIPESEKAAYRQLQRSIPRDATVMVRLRTNYALDFRHNNVLIADFPGTVSPPPGLPFQKGPEPLAAYLLDQGVRYVAFSYSSQADFTRDRFGDRVADDYPHDWLREEAARAFDFQSNLTQLGQSRLRIYDDGDNFVLDLTAKRKEPGQP